MATRKTSEKAGPGRPRSIEGDDAQPVNIRLSAQQREKLKRLGGPPWVRDRIDKAKEPDRKD